MGQTGNKRILWAIRLVIGLPLIIPCFYVFIFWNNLVLDVALYFLLVIGVVVTFLIARAQVPESFSAYQYTEHHVKEAQVVHRNVFTIPIVCPVCKTSLKLDEVKWQDQHTLLCQECHSEITVSIT